MDKLPVYQMVIDETVTSDVEVAAVAFVDKPAIERNFLAFKNEALFFAVDQEQRIVSGPAMIADQLIFRQDEQGGYYVFFSADTIKQIALKFFKKDYQKNLNLFHDPTLALDGVTIFESFVSDKVRGIPTMKGFEDLPDGTWFISAKIENDQVWEKIKSGEVKGFSVEGIFSFVKRQNRTEAHNSHLNANTVVMADLKAMFAEIKDLLLGTPAAPAPTTPEALGTDYTKADGTPLSIDKLEVGGVCLANGAPCPPGPCELSDGTKLMIGEGGVITEVAPKEMPMAAPDFSEQFKNYDQKFADYESKLNSYEQRFTEMGSQLSNANATIVKLVSIVEQLAEAPTADPLGDTKGSFSSMKVETKDDNRKKFAEAFQALKSKTK
jgi:hypothetical protein